mmetsp:Transcript_16203/g.33841  ORF Transcript_16203/g.33841 Transcript_16203/m.33841 type:complete len:231 (-) Transcript_16203:170-862(-)
MHLHVPGGNLALQPRHYPILLHLRNDLRDVALIRVCVVRSLGAFELKGHARITNLLMFIKCLQRVLPAAILVSFDIGLNCHPFFPRIFLIFDFLFDLCRYLIIAFNSSKNFTVFVDILLGIIVCMNHVQRFATFVGVLMRIARQVAEDLHNCHRLVLDVLPAVLLDLFVHFLHRLLQILCVIAKVRMSLVEGDVDLLQKANLLVKRLLRMHAIRVEPAEHRHHKKDPRHP